MILHLYLLISKKEEYCFNILIESELTSKEKDLLFEVLCDGFDKSTLSEKPYLDIINTSGIEIGPLMNFETAFSTNVVSIFNNIGLSKVKRVEKSIRYLTDDINNILVNKFDKMTHTIYEKPLENFESGKIVENIKIIPLLENGINAFDEVEGLSFTRQDKEIYFNYFVNEEKRNPTDVELFDLANSNCEHSRHGFFNASLKMDGIEIDHTLFDLVRATLRANEKNSVIGFHDNSSAIYGSMFKTLVPKKTGNPSSFKMTDINYDITLTAETHNFPTGIEPFGGAETGAGGRIRDGMATGKGSNIIAGSASYSVSSLHIPGYNIPGETKGSNSPLNMATPLDILIQASNGASNYGNEFGEPVILGSCYSFDLTLPNGERWAYVKPIMFTAGIGLIRHSQTKKEKPKSNMLIVQVGGPAYRIGFGGGAASSLNQGENAEQLDFNAVQRGNAEMENKVYRVVRTCNEMGENTPIASIHDQGAGGPGNVLKELVEKAGGIINIRKIISGDKSLSVLEMWVCEFQERNGFLIPINRIQEFKKICKREKINCEVLGKVTNDGRFVVKDSNNKSTPVNFNLKSILEDFPTPKYSDNIIDLNLKPLELPENITILDALKKVFKLPSVGSKGFLVHKVDRSVSGLIAQQQCIGELGLPLANLGAVALSHFETKGAVTSRGEKPTCMIVNPSAGARMSVGEMLTNMVWAGGIDLTHIKCSTNWMWAPKKPGEGVALYDACFSMTELMPKLGIASDGGKDSLSMATEVDGKLVKSPRTLVVSGYCDIPDIRNLITPDIKKPGLSYIFYIDLSSGKSRLGGSALAQVFNQVGNESPDLNDPDLFLDIFNAIQKLIENKLILSGHDISDGGLITSLCEMSFAGNCGMHISLNNKKNIIEKLFSEELGLLFEVSNENTIEVINFLETYDIIDPIIGHSVVNKQFTIINDNNILINENTDYLRELWSETSYQLEKIQSNSNCAEMEKKNTKKLKKPKIKLSFTPYPTPSNIINSKKRIKVAVLREEGSNGEREMISALTIAGFNPFDICMKDLLSDEVTLDKFQGLIAVGGFSYADYPSSAKGWAVTIKSNQKLKEMFDNFKNRSDTFSFGVCNGCQMLSLLGWVSFKKYDSEKQARFVQNDSGRFESRYSLLKIPRNNSIMFKDMENSIIPIWSAHGEGKLSAGKKVIDKLIVKGNVIGYYSKNNGDYADPNDYPANPNGSPYGIAGLCSSDGRHTVMMPHPERLFQLWQFPWLPEKFQNLEASPWLKIFQNAREWCENKNKKK